MVGLFASALSPVVSYITFGMSLPLLTGMLLGNLVGIAIGFVLPPLAAQTLIFHRGFTSLQYWVYFGIDCNDYYQYSTII